MSSRPWTQHDALHERMMLLACGLVLLDLLLGAVVSKWVYEDWRAMGVFLFPALPAAFGAFAHWIAGLRPAATCYCRGDRPAD